MSDTNERTGLFSGFFAVVLAFGQSRGLEVEDMAATAGLTPFDIMDPSKRHPEEAMIGVWSMLRDTDRDGTMPIKFVQGAPLTIYAGLAEGVLFADTLGSALEHMIRNQVIIADRLMLDIRRTPKSPILSVKHSLDAKDDGYLSAVGLLLTKRLISDVLGVDGAPVVVRLRLPDSPAHPNFEAFFGCPVHLGQLENEMELDENAYAHDINHANAELFAYVEAYLAQRRKSLEQQPHQSRLDLLRDAIVEQSLHSDYSPASVAQRANLSLRSAQRLALQEGYTLQRLIDEVRFENAKAMLRNLDLPVSQIADALSYSDDRSFRRAFKRIVGQSPTAYRSSLRSKG